jgi:hypothetical protein
MCLADLQQTKQNTFLLEPHLAKKKKEEEGEEEEAKFHNPEPQPIKSFSTPPYTEKIGRLQCSQTLAPTCLEDADQQDWMLEE